MVSFNKFGLSFQGKMIDLSCIYCIILLKLVFNANGFVKNIIHYVEESLNSKFVACM